MAARNGVVDAYGQLASHLSLMVALARAKEWDRLPELETECEAMVDRLRQIPAVRPLDPVQIEQARRLLARIRADQEEVCRLVQPQLQQLMQKMDQLQKQKNLGKAYGHAG